MQYDLFFGGVGIEFPAQFVQVAVDDVGALTAGSPEHGVFHEMGDAGGVALLVPRSAADGERAERYGASVSAHGISESLGSSSCRHLFLARRFKSSGRKPAPFRAVILCLEK